MMRDILISCLNARKGDVNASHQGTERMARQPGRIICESLESLQLEISEMSNLTQTQKVELLQAAKNLWLVRGCDKMSRRDE